MKLRNIPKWNQASIPGINVFLIPVSRAIRGNRFNLVNSFLCVIRFYVIPSLRNYIPRNVTAWHHKALHLEPRVTTPRFGEIFKFQKYTSRKLCPKLTQVVLSSDRLPSLCQVEEITAGQPPEPESRRLYHLPHAHAHQHAFATSTCTYVPSETHSRMHARSSHHKHKNKKKLCWTKGQRSISPRNTPQTHRDEAELQLYPFLTSALDKGEVSTMPRPL